MSNFSSIELLQKLVRIPSINPGQAKNADWAGEVGVIDYLRPLLESWGAEVCLDGPTDGRPNLIARWAPRDGRPRVLLGPHMDTVDVTGMTIDPFAAEIREGKVWGRGASDTKGSMAAMLAALSGHRDRLVDAPVAVDFVAFSDEELYQSGSIDFAAKYATEYEFAFVGEPTRLELVHCSKGACHIKLEAQGKASHASQPERGDNAIWKLSSALQRIQSEFLPRLESDFIDPILGRTTLSPGLLRGGIQTNVVAPMAEVMLDCRFTPACAEVGGPAVLLENFIRDSGLEVTLVQHKSNPPMSTPRDHPWLVRVLDRMPDLVLSGAPWFSDAAHLAAAGLPAVCVGPGDIAQAHTEDEFICLEDLRAGTAFFNRLLTKLIA